MVSSEIFLFLKTRHYNSFRAASKELNFIYKLFGYQSSLPSRTIAQQELSMSVGRLEPRHALRHMRALRRRAKLYLVRMYVIASEYDSSFFSAILLASCFKVRVADGPAPKCRKTRTERIYFSRRQVSVAQTSGTSTTHDNCTLLRIFFEHDLASGLKIFTSKQKRLKLYSHRLFTLMSSRAFSSILVILCIKDTPWSNWRVGSTSTS